LQNDRFDVKVGGTHRMPLRNFITNESHSFDGEYVELAPDERPRYAARVDDPNRPGQIQVTVTLKKVWVDTD
jgi:uncharacterized protein YndB with AHSA1/START domain